MKDPSASAKIFFLSCFSFISFLSLFFVYTLIKMNFISTGQHGRLVARVKDTFRLVFESEFTYVLA